MADLLPLTPDELLSTTRAVRKRLDFDRPVPLELVTECVAMAQQAPTGSNMQGWHFVVVTDPAKRAALGAIYRKAFETYRTSPMYAGAIQTGDARRDAQQQRVASSADYLAEHMGDAPVLVIPCVEGRPAGRSPQGIARSAGGLYGAILPASWSFMLAARARGLGTCWTTLHLMFEEEAAEVVGIPFDQVTQALLTPVAYTKGTDFKPAARPPAASVMHVDGW
jgi:nitroreductase